MPSDVPPVLPVLTGPGNSTDIWTALYIPVTGMVRGALGVARIGRLDPNREDLVAEATYAALTNVCRYRSGFRGASEGEARAWLRTVSRNALRRVAGRHARWRTFHTLADPHALESLGDRRLQETPPVWSRREAWALIVRALPSPALRDLWLLSERPGRARSSAEIATLTGRTPGSVAVSLSRARSAIRRELAAAGQAC